MSFNFPHPCSRHTSIHFPTKLAVDASRIGLLSGLVATCWISGAWLVMTDPGVWLGYSAWLYWTDGKLRLGDLGSVELYES